MATNEELLKKFKTRTSSTKDAKGRYYTIRPTVTGETYYAFIVTVEDGEEKHKLVAEGTIEQVLNALKLFILLNLEV